MNNNEMRKLINLVESASRQDDGVAEGKEELRSQLMDINRKLKMMRQGPEPGEINSVALVDKRQKLQKQKKEILAKLKSTDENSVSEL